MNHLQHLENKIIEPSGLDALLSEWKKQQYRVVFTNGCFDLLHRGHIDYLSRAASLGDKLFIGVNTDASVSALKGPGRPIQDERSRLMILAALSFTGAVMLFGKPTPYELIRKVQPDVLVKGSDYRPEDIVGYDIVTARGGQVLTIDYLPGFSTSAIEARIRNGK